MIWLTASAFNRAFVDAAKRGALRMLAILAVGVPVGFALHQCTSAAPAKADYAGAMQIVVRLERLVDVQQSATRAEWAQAYWLERLARATERCACEVSR